MAISITARGTRTILNNSVGGSLAYTSSLAPQNFTAGTAVVCFAYSNEGGGGADGFTSFSDQIGNTWTLRLVQVADPAGSGAGTILRIYTTPQNGGLITTSTIFQLNWSRLSEEVALSFYQVNVAAGTNLNFINTTGASFETTTSLPSVTSPSLATGNAVIGAVAYQHSTALTADSDTTGGSWSAVQRITAQGTLSGGGVNNAQSITTQFKILTSASTQTYNPVLSGTGSYFAIGIMSMSEVSGGTNSYTILAESRTIIETLNPANILKGSKVFADVRAFTITRLDATLFKSRSLIAEGRTFNEVLNPANIIATRKIVAELLAEIITFPETFVVVPKKIIADGSSLALAFFDSDFIYDIFAIGGYDLQAETLAEVISTTETIFIAPPAPPIMPPPPEGGQAFLIYTLTANGRDLKISRKTAQGIITKVGLLTADTGAATGTWSGTFGTRYTLINDIADTTGTSVLTHGTTAGSHDFLHQILSTIPAGSSVNRVVLRYTARRNGGATSVIRANLGVRNATNQVVKYNATIRTPVNGTLTTYDETWNLNPATNANWTIAQIAANSVANGGTLGLLAGQIGFTSTDANPSISISRAFILTTYTLYEIKEYFIILDGYASLVDPTFTNLNFNRRIIASGTSMALSMKDAVIKRVFVIPIVTKSFTITMVPAGLIKTKKLVADVKSFLITAPNTNVAKATRMTASGLSMIMSSFDVVFKKGINLVASGRALTISYTGVGLTKNLILTASGRSVSITGNNVGTLATRKVVASVGALSLTSSGVSLIHIAQIAASGRSVSINGVAVIVKKGSLITAAKGSLVTSSSATGLIYARRIPISVAALQIQGKVVNLTRISLYNLSADARSFTTTLNPSVLKAAFRLPAVVKNIAISGQFAYLKKEVIFSVGKATFLIVPIEINLKLKAGIIFKMWTGTQWKFARLKVWNGFSWVGELKRWNGTIWKNK